MEGCVCVPVVMSSIACSTVCRLQSVQHFDHECLRQVQTYCNLLSYEKAGHHYDICSRSYEPLSSYVYVTTYVHMYVRVYTDAMCPVMYVRTYVMCPCVCRKRAGLCAAVLYSPCPAGHRWDHLQGAL